MKKKLDMNKIAMTQSAPHSHVNLIRHKIFLGGTCAETTWREELISYLDVPYFIP